jgi:predicted permease
LCWWAGLDRVLALTLFIESAMPVATMVSLFAEQYHQAQDCAARCVLVSTILSAFTLPVVLLLAPALS